jgi:hypothetical protein
VSSGLKRILALACGALAVSPLAGAQSLYIDRLSVDELAVRSPAERVRGAPGEMQVLETACASLPESGLRERIVSIAVQEWAYFGFSVADETAEPAARGGFGGGDPFGGRSRRSGRGFSRVDLEEAERLAGSIAGYWAITGDGSWILSRQNEVWSGSGVGARWRDPWSAAFISWVMCESGLDNARFDRAINHHTYIDQAIRARDGGSTATAYAAYDVGEQPIEPGDLLCAARRPTYDTLDERRRQLGDGIRSHCDIVVKLEPDSGRVLAIGGNVRGSVSLKLLPAEYGAGDEIAVDSVGRGRARIFAHLKLRADPIADDAFRVSPTWRRLAEQPELVEQVRARLEQAVRSLSQSVLL